MSEFLASAGRERFVIAFGYGLTAQASPSAAEVGSHRRAMHTDDGGSLRRLGTERIAIHMPHFDDGVTPVEDTVKWLDDLVRAGKILHIGPTSMPAKVRRRRACWPICPASRPWPCFGFSTVSRNAKPSASICPWHSPAGWP